jgi:tRNA(Ile)-lysidine synthase
MARAREALARGQKRWRTGRDDWSIRHLRIDRDGFAKVERDTQLRLLAAALQWVGGAEYRPRAAPLEALLDRALAGGGGTLHGAQVDVTRDRSSSFGSSRPFERGRGGGAVLAVGRTLEDIRAADQGAGGSCLGDDGWRQMLRPSNCDRHPGPEIMPRPSHAVARALPAVFEGDRLVGFVPCAFGLGYVAEFRPPQGHFLALLNPH